MKRILMLMIIFSLIISNNVLQAFATTEETTEDKDRVRTLKEADSEWKKNHENKLSKWNDDDKEAAHAVVSMTEWEYLKEYLCFYPEVNYTASRINAVKLDKSVKKLEKPIKKAIQDVMENDSSFNTYELNAEDYSYLMMAYIQAINEDADGKVTLDKDDPCRIVKYNSEAKGCVQQDNLIYKAKKGSWYSWYGKKDSDEASYKCLFKLLVQNMNTVNRRDVATIYKNDQYLRAAVQSCIYPGYYTRFYNKGNAKDYYTSKLSKGQYYNKNNELKSFKQNDEFAEKVLSHYSVINILGGVPIHGYPNGENTANFDETVNGKYASVESNASKKGSPSMRIPKYWQDDFLQPWQYEDGSNGSGTIKDSGQSITSLAMVLSYEAGAIVDPRKLAQNYYNYHKKSSPGYKDSMIKDISSDFGITGIEEKSSLSEKQLIKYLKNGQPIMMYVKGNEYLNEINKDNVVVISGMICYDGGGSGQSDVYGWYVNDPSEHTNKKGLSEYDYASLMKGSKRKFYIFPKKVFKAGDSGERYSNVVNKVKADHSATKFKDTVAPTRQFPIPDKDVQALIKELKKHNTASQKQWRIIEVGASLIGKTKYSQNLKNRDAAKDHPTYLDCSSFASWAYHQAGYKVPFNQWTGTLGDMIADGKILKRRSSFKKAQVGDLCLHFDDTARGRKGVSSKSGSANHALIYAGKDKYGHDVWLECSSGQGGRIAVNDGVRFSNKSYTPDVIAYGVK